MKKILKWLFGEPIKGEKISIPTLKTIEPYETLSFNNWVNYTQFSREWIRNNNR